jgi:tetratricopeptide (TPR) repeat protein
MLEFGACPRCKLDVSAERKKSLPVICDHCGFTLTNNENQVKKVADRQTMILFGSFSLFVLISFFQLTNWDNYSLEIIPLKIKATLGMTSPGDADRTAQICMDLKKWDCVESNYSRFTEASPERLTRLGQFQMKRAEYNEAAQTFYTFFKKGGNNLEASYSYAKALAQLGQIDDATKYFDQVLAARPDVLQVTVVTNYVKLLMDHQRYDQARKLIQDVRSKGPQTASFMETELQKIKSVTTASRE